MLQRKSAIIPGRDLEICRKSFKERETKRLAISAPSKYLSHTRSPSHCVRPFRERLGFDHNKVSLPLPLCPFLALTPALPSPILLLGIFLRPALHRRWFPEGSPDTASK